MLKFLARLRVLQCNDRELNYKKVKDEQTQKTTNTGREGLVSFSHIMVLPVLPLHQQLFTKEQSDFACYP